jgi:hypothetical protein
LGDSYIGFSCFRHFRTFQWTPAWRESFTKRTDSVIGQEQLTTHTSWWPGQPTLKFVVRADKAQAVTAELRTMTGISPELIQR